MASTARPQEPSAWNLPVQQGTLRRAREEALVALSLTSTQPGLLFSWVHFLHVPQVWVTVQ